MTKQAPPDLLDLAEAVASGALGADEAERQVRASLASDHDDAADRAALDLRRLIVATGAVRAHALATREAFGAAGPDLAHASGSIQTIVPGPVRAGAARRRSPRGGDGRAPRRTWLLVAATLALGTGLIGASLVGGRLITPGPVPTNPNAAPDASANPKASPNLTTAPEWSVTGSMGIARGGFSTTLLPDGKVLVVGGDALVEGVDTASAELYDPASGTWTAAGSMATPRSGHTATLLPDGKVLVAGGGRQATNFTYLPSAELYDPASGTWTAAGSMATPRTGHTATLLRDGKVLVVGGETESSDFPGNPEGVASAELYDAVTGTWTPTASMPTQRFGHTATLLRNGEVLVAGGACCGASPEPVISAELYDPTTGSWHATASTAQSHMYLPATLLSDGRVLVLGASTELFDPNTGSWTTTGTMMTTGLGCSATLLPDGKVLVAGGVDRHLNDGWGGLLTSAELYDPGTGLWTATASMVYPRCGTGTLLRDGRVLVAGGAEPAAGGEGMSAELYDPGTGR
jgi:hypothetical protein